MNYIYCHSYQQIYFALHLRNKGESVAVITANESLVKFCEYSGIACYQMNFQLDDYPPSLSMGVRMLARRAYLDRFLASLDIRAEDNFYFVSRLADVSCLYLAKQWSRLGRAYLVDLEVMDYWLWDRNAHSLGTGRLGRLQQSSALGRLLLGAGSDRSDKLRWIDSLVRVLLGRDTSRVDRQRWNSALVRLIFGLRLRIYDLASAKLALGADIEFLKESGIASVDVGSNEQLILEAIGHSSIPVGDCNNIVFSSYPAAVGNYYEYSELKDLYMNLSTITTDLCVKAHPVVSDYDRQQADIERFFHGFQVLPSYLPAELLLTSVRRNVLSIDSTALIAAGRMRHLKAISLMDLVEYRSKRKEWKERHRNLLRERSGNNIVFVKDYEELARHLVS